MSHSKSRIFLITTGIILGIFLIGYLGINPLLNYVLKEQVEKKLVGNFTIKYDTIMVNIFDRSVKMKNVAFQFPKDSSEVKTRGSVSEFAVKGISWWSVFGDLKIDEISIAEPKFNTQISANKLFETKSDTTKKSKFNFYKLIEGNLNSLNVESIIIERAAAKWYSPDFSQIWRELDNGNLHVSKFVIDSATAAQNNGLFGLSDFSLDFKSAKLYLPDSLHSIILGNTIIDYERNMLSIDSMRLEPIVTKQQLNAKFKYEKTRIHLKAPKIRIFDIDFNRIIKEQKLDIAKVVIENLYLEAFKDKNAVEPTFKRPPLPQSVLKDLTNSLTIDTLQLTNSYIQYEQKAEKSNEVGKVDFTKLNAIITHITNDSLELAKNPNMLFSFNTFLFGKSSLKADVNFNLKSKSNSHNIVGSLAPIDLADANEILTPIMAFSIRSGKLSKFKFDFTLTNTHSSGVLDFRYEDLKLEKMDSKSLNEGDFKDKLFTFAANTFAIRDANPGWLGDVRTGEIDFDRVMHKSIFHYWWQSLRTGIQSTVVPGQSK